MPGSGKASIPTAPRWNKPSVPLQDRSYAPASLRRSQQRSQTPRRDGGKGAAGAQGAAGGGGMLHGRDTKCRSRQRAPVAAALWFPISSPLHPSLLVFNYLENNLHSIYSPFGATSEGPSIFNVFRSGTNCPGLFLLGWFFFFLHFSRICLSFFFLLASFYPKPRLLSPPSTHSPPTHKGPG